MSRAGSVLEFDEAAGLGTVRADDGHEYPFHCVAVADGSRRLPVGARVSFVVVPGLPGRWEADDVAQVPASPPASPGGRGASPPAGSS